MKSTIELIDELKRKVYRAKDNREKLSSLVSLILHLIDARHYAEAKNFSEKALVLAVSLKDEQNQALLHYTTGTSLIRLDMTSQALDHLKKGLRISQQINDLELLSNIINTIGFTYNLVNDYEKALEYYLESIKYNEKNTAALNNAGYLYSLIKDYRKSLDYLWKGYKLTKESNDPKYNILALTTLINIATDYYCLEQFDVALEHFKTVFDDARKNSYFGLEIYACTGISRVYNRIADKKNAETYMKKAETIVEKYTKSSSILGYYLYIAEAYEDLENYEKAFNYFQKYLTQKQKNYTDELSQKLSSIHATFEAEKKELEMMRVIENSSRLATIGVIAEGITQDINNPLNVIKISADSILFWDKRNCGYLPDIITKVVKDVSDSSKRIDDIIVHMRQFWLNPELNTEECTDINNAIDNALFLIASRISSHGIDLKTTTAKEKLMVRGNQIYLEQIVINLVFNSIQVLDSIKQEKKTIEIKSYRKNGKANFEISDNGPGLPLNIIDKIYEPFYTTKGKKENMGLGLAIVRQIVDRFNGMITYNKNESGGATFSLAFPLSAED